MSLFLAMAYFMPSYVRRLWGLRPLERDGLYRPFLEAFIASRDFRARDILTWDTDMQVVNAAIVGLTPGTRYILFTDAMLERLSLPELRCVLAHEMGHGVRRHLVLYLLFSTAFIFGITLVESLCFPFAGFEEEAGLYLTAMAPAALFYWWFLFGFLSRRFEQEADLYGAEASNDPELFIQTLEHVALTGRVKRRRGSWRHFSIERRIAVLRRFFFEDPSSTERFRITMRRARYLLYAASAILSLAFLCKMSVDSVAGAGLRAFEREDYARAEQLLTLAEGLPGGASHGWALLPVHLRSGHTEKAQALLERLLEGKDPGDLPDRFDRLVIATALSLLEADRTEAGGPRHGSGSRGLYRKRGAQRAEVPDPPFRRGGSGPSQRLDTGAPGRLRTPGRRRFSR